MKKRINLKLGDIKPNPDQFANKLVTTWFVEQMRGERQVERLQVRMVEVRHDPFVVSLEEEYVTEMARKVRDLGPLLVGRLPGGGFVDVDSPNACEAYRRAGVNFVDVEVMGEFTIEDCRRIGLPTRWPDDSGTQT